MKIQFFAPQSALGGFTAPCGGGRVCLHATADLPARGVEVWMQASPMALEQMPSEAAHKVFNDARRQIEASHDVLEALKGVLDLMENWHALEGTPCMTKQFGDARRAIRKSEGGAV